MLLILWLITPVYAVEVDNGLPVLYEQGRLESQYVIQTEYGNVRGSLNGDIVQYIDIPYGRFEATSPFQAPSAPTPWENTVENQQHESKCPQLSSDGTFVGTNECLTLSVFTPNGVQNADVLFHIFDGDFMAGSGDPDVYSPNLLVPEGIILVLPNYRVGSLGFMCWQNESVPGNAGLKDLLLALNWTRHNIGAFGGNASNIVVSGSGSAGALVDYLVMANESSAIISKAITESGFALSHWAVDRHPSILNRDIDNDLECLVKAFKNETFRPCLENEGGVITHSFWHHLRRQNVTIPYMIGSANQASMQAVLQLDEVYLAKLNENVSYLLPNDLAISGHSRNDIANRVKTHYFGNDNITTYNIDKLSLCLTDIGYTSPGVRQARALTSAGATVYFYEFSYTGDRKNPIHGATKGDSLQYVFNKDVVSKEPSDGENRMSHIMKELWISFIKTGIPSADNVEWRAFRSRSGREDCLQIDSEIKLVHNLHAERLQLWDEIYDQHFIDINFGTKLKPPTLILFAIFIVNVQLLSNKGFDS